MNRMLIIAAFLSFLFGSASYGLRCQNQLITIGDSEAKVLQACGKPIAKSKTKISILDREISTAAVKLQRQKNARVTIWTYDFGSSDFIYRLIFSKGKVIKIETEQHALEK